MERKFRMSAETLTWPKWLPRVLWVRRMCPYCNGAQFKPAELRSFDFVLEMFFLHPIRCKFCWRRFYWFALKAAE
jgi:hypothetical protein